MPRKLRFTWMLARKTLIALGAGLLVVIASLSFLRYTSALTRAESGLRHLQVAQSQLSSEGIALASDKLEAVERELTAAEADFRGARSDLWPFDSVSPMLGWVPGVGPELKAAPPLLDMATSASTAGRLACEGMEPLAELASQGRLRVVSLEGFDERILVALAAGRGKFQEAQIELGKARQLRQSLSQGDLPRRFSGYLSQVDSLAQLEPTLRAAAAAPELLTSLLGLDQPQSYLILAQNSLELRATGGFMSGVWLITLDQGRVTRLDFLDSADVDDPSKPAILPPEPLFKYMQAGVWLFRDTNWSPDFPTSARVAEDFYQMGQGVSVDGVIAIDEAGLRSVVKALGPIYVQGVAEPITESNLQERLENGLYPGPEEGAPSTLRPSKLFMKALAEALLGRLLVGLSAPDMTSLLAAVQRTLVGRHLVLYLHQEAARRLLAENGWDGALRPADGDYLMAVDSNVGYNKVNAAIVRAIEYQVSLDTDRPQARATITYRNLSTEKVAECVQQTTYTTYEKWKSGCYWNYFRLLVPGDSQLTRATYIPLPRGSLLSWMGHATSNEPTVGPPEADRQAFANFFAVAPGESRSVTFEYDLPKQVLNGSAQEWRYHLLVQKQAGTTANSLRVRVVLPNGARVVATAPQTASLQGYIIEFQTDLAVDREFTVVFQSGGGGRP